MSDNSKLLLLDLLKINIIYKDKEFEEVITALKLNQDDYLVSLINQMREQDLTQTKIDNKRKPNKAEQSFEILGRLKDTNSEKYRILNQIYEMLMSKEIFRTVKDLQEFISQRVHLTTKKNTKNDLINRYLSQHINVSLNELENELGLLIDKSNSNDDVSKFMDMANEIVNSRKEKRY